MNIFWNCTLGGGGGCVGQRVIHYQPVHWHPPPSLIFFFKEQADVHRLYLIHDMLFEQNS